MADSEQPKIIVDSDWKKQAKAEKQKLEAVDKAVEAKKDRAAGPAGAAAPGTQRGGQPAPDGAEPTEDDFAQTGFGTLLGTLVTQALLYLGGFPDPQTGRAVVSLEHAAFHIDLLSVLKDKTKGNLTPQETEDLDQALHELRQRFVEVSRAVAAMAAKQAGGQGGGRPGSGPMGTSGMTEGPDPMGFGNLRMGS